MPHPSNERYYHPGPAPNDERSWGPHMDSYELMVGGTSAILSLTPLRVIGTLERKMTRMTSS